MKDRDGNTITIADIRPMSDLRVANLTWTELTGADLRMSDLRVANLTWTELTGADLPRSDNYESPTKEGTDEAP